MSDTAERVKKIVIEHLGVDADKVTEQASFIDDLGADSLDRKAPRRRPRDNARQFQGQFCGQERPFRLAVGLTLQRRGQRGHAHGSSKSPLQTGVRADRA